MVFNRSDEEEILAIDLAEARGWAKRGEAWRMEYYLKSVRMRAQITGQDISERVAAIEKEGYKTAIPVKLATARKDAEQGNAPLMELRLDIAQDYAQRAGQDISAQVAQIRAGLKTI